MTAGTATFELPEMMKIDDCQALHAFLDAAQDQPVTINCTKVTRLGGLAAQLLLFGVRVWTCKGLSFLLAEPSAEFTQCLSDLGLSEQLAMKGVAE